MESSRTAAMFHAEAAGQEGDAHASNNSNSLSNYLRVQRYKYHGSLSSLHSSGGSNVVSRRNLFSIFNITSISITILS